MTRLNEIRERLEAATPGPWAHTPKRVLASCRDDEIVGCDYSSASSAQDSLNVALIAHAPEDIAWLLEAVRLGDEFFKRYDRLEDMARDGAIQTPDGHTCGPEGNCDMGCMDAANDAETLSHCQEQAKAYRAHVAEQPDAKADNPESAQNA